jgi:hypothetical protein
MTITCWLDWKGNDMSEYVAVDETGIVESVIRAQSPMAHAIIKEIASQHLALEAKLAATEVRLEAALDACRAYVASKAEFAALGYLDIESGQIYDQCNAAIAMSPADAASVIEERDRLLVLLQDMVDKCERCSGVGRARDRIYHGDGGFDCVGEPFDCPECADARQALATKGEANELPRTNA